MNVKTNFMSLLSLCSLVFFTTSKINMNVTALKNSAIAKIIYLNMINHL